jgi:hypothetical protein
MLKKLDTEHLNRLALAEALANMSTDDFDMRDASRCICGHALRMFGERSTQFFVPWQSQRRTGAALLGLSIGQARELSCRPIAPRRGVTTIPIRRMRHEWCAISRPPIPSIGALLASFSREVVRGFGFSH